MKGNPLLRLSVVLILLLALLWPICKITQGETRKSSPSPPGHASAVSLSTNPPSQPSSWKATLVVHAVPAPMDCSITQCGRILLSGKDRVASGEYRTIAEIVSGEDLVISSRWENDEPHALRVEVLAQDRGESLDKSFWARKTLEDAIAIPANVLP